MKMNTTTLIIATLLLSYSLALYAQVVSYNQEFQVNTYTNNNQLYPSVSGLWTVDLWCAGGVLGRTAAVTRFTVNSLIARGPGKVLNFR